MHKFNPFRTKLHQESSYRSKTRGRSNTIDSTHRAIFDPSIDISAPIINCSDKVIINDEDQSNENSNEEQTTSLENERITEEQTAIFEEPELISARYEHRDDQVD